MSSGGGGTHPILQKADESVRSAKRAAKAAQAAQVAAESAAKAAEAAYGAAVEAISAVGPAAAKAAIDATNASSSAHIDTSAGVLGGHTGRMFRALDVQVASPRLAADSADWLEVTPVVASTFINVKGRGRSRTSSTGAASASSPKRRWRVVGMPVKLAARIAQKRVGNDNVVRMSGGGGNVISKGEAARAVEQASSRSLVVAAAGPQLSDLQSYVGKWKAAGVEGREEFMKAMQLPWILRKIAAALPQPDNVFFIDDEAVLRSHVSTLGRVVEEVYKDGNQSTKSFKGVTTTITYHWDGAQLAYVAAKARPSRPLLVSLAHRMRRAAPRTTMSGRPLPTPSPARLRVGQDGAPEEEAKSRRWVEADGVTMRAESHFRKNASQPWVVLLRTWQLDPASRRV